MCKVLEERDERIIKQVMELLLDIVQQLRQGKTPEAIIVSDVDADMVVCAQKIRNIT